MSNKVYKIRDSNGLFSPGGTNGYNNEIVPLKFNKNGKIWKQVGHVKSHLKSLRLIGSDWEIVEFNLVESKVFKAAEYKGKNSITTDELIIKDIIE